MLKISILNRSYCYMGTKADLQFILKMFFSGSQRGNWINIHLSYYANAVDGKTLDEIGSAEAMKILFA